MNRNLIIVDAVDSSGKTKLCEHLIEKYRFNYYHCGVKPNIKEYHKNVLNTTVGDIIDHDSNFVIDRLHLSEQVYGTIFRAGPQYDWKEMNATISEVCNKNNVKYTLIICLPPKDIVLKGHAERNAKGDEMFDTVDSVYDAYEKIYEENKNIMNIYKYDFTNDSNYIKLDEYLESL